jgi:hypothetical protein
MRTRRRVMRRFALIEGERQEGQILEQAATHGQGVGGQTWPRQILLGNMRWSIHPGYTPLLVMLSHGGPVRTKLSPAAMELPEIRENAVKR